MNGSAWLTVTGRRVDLHYRDLDDVERHLAEAEQGRFTVERLPFYLAGIPTYVVAGELAVAGCWPGSCHGQGSRRRRVSGRGGSGWRPRGCRSATPRVSARRGVMRWLRRGARPGGGRGRARAAGRPGRVGAEREAHRGARRPGRARPTLRAAGRHTPGVAWCCRGGPRGAARRVRRVTHRRRGPWCRESGSTRSRLPCSSPTHTLIPDSGPPSPGRLPRVLAAAARRPGDRLPYASDFASRGWRRGVSPPPGGGQSGLAAGLGLARPA